MSRVDWWEKKEELPSVAGFVRLRKPRMGGHVISHVNYYIFSAASLERALRSAETKYIYLFISYYLRSRFLIYNLGAVHRMVDSVRGIRTP